MIGGSSGGATHTVPKWRLYAVGILILASLLGYVAYLFSLQVVRGYIYELRAEQVTRRSMVIAAPRGFIYDRNMDTPVAASRESFARQPIPVLRSFLSLHGLIGGSCSATAGTDISSRFSSAG